MDDFLRERPCVRRSSGGMARSWDNAASQEMLLRQEAAVEEVGAVHSQPSEAPVSVGERVGGSTKRAGER